MNFLSLFQVATIDPTHESACLLGRLSSENWSLPAELRQKYEAALRAAVKSADEKSVPQEEFHTRLAYEQLAEIIAEHAIKEHKTTFELEQDGIIHDQPWRKRHDWHLGKREEAKLRVESQLLAATLIGKERTTGRLYRDSSLIAILPGSSWASTVTLRSDRLTFGWSATTLSPQTKVTLNVDGAVETVIVGSNTVSRTNFSGDITPNRNQFLGNNSLSFLGNSRTDSSTRNILRVVDNRSVQLIVTDSTWQFSLSLGAESVNQARAFAERLQMEINALKNATPLQERTSKSPSDVVSGIRELGLLLKDGIITKSEFETLKAKILAAE
jgi:hypothetical protein